MHVKLLAAGIGWQGITGTFRPHSSGMFTSQRAPYFNIAVMCTAVTGGCSRMTLILIISIVKRERKSEEVGNHRHARSVG